MRKYLSILCVLTILLTSLSVFYFSATAETDLSSWNISDVVTFGGTAFPNGANVLTTAGVTTYPSWVNAPTSAVVSGNKMVFTQDIQECRSIIFPDSTFSENYNDQEELWVYMKADPVAAGTKIGLAVSFKAHITKTDGTEGWPEYKIKNSSTYYYENGSGGWTTGNDASWGKAYVPVAYEGWVRLPLNTDTFTTDSSDPGDLSMDILEIQTVSVAVNYQNVASSATYTSEISRIVLASKKAVRVATDTTNFTKQPLVEFGGTAFPDSANVLTTTGVTTYPGWVNAPTSAVVSGNKMIFKQDIQECRSIIFPDSTFSKNYNDQEELWVYMKADPAAAGTKIGLSVSFKAHITKTDGTEGWPEYKIKNNSTYYYEDGNGGWATGSDASWGKAFFPVGYEGWVRLPLNTNTFTTDSSDPGDLSMDILEIQTVSVAVNYQNVALSASYTSEIHEIILASARVVTDTSGFTKQPLVEFGGTAFPDSTNVLTTTGVTTYPSWVNAPTSAVVSGNKMVFSQDIQECRSIVFPDSTFSENYNNQEELWVYMKADPAAAGTKIGLAVSFKAHITKTDGTEGWPEYKIKNGSTYYYEDGNGGWATGSDTSWGKAFFPVGYEGWVRLPLNTNTFTTDSSDPGDLSMDILEIQTVSVGVNYQNVAAKASYTSEISQIVLAKSLTNISYKLTTVAGTGSTISPASPSVKAGENQTFTVTVQTGYTLLNVTVDGTEVTLTNNQFTIENVSKAMQIVVNVSKNRVPSDTSGYTIKPLVEFGGTVFPNAANVLATTGVFYYPSWGSAPTSAVVAGDKMVYTQNVQECQHIQFPASTFSNNYSDQKELWVYMKADPAASGGSNKIGLAVNFKAHVTKTTGTEGWPIYKIKNSGTFYYEDGNGGWATSNDVSWGKAFVPVGYEGWVRLPLDSDTFAIDSGEASDLSMDILDIENVGVMVNYQSVSQSQVYTSEIHQIALAKSLTEEVTYKLSTVAGVGSTITPFNPKVKAGDSKTFTVTMLDGYTLGSVTVDGTEVTVTNNQFTVENVSKNSKIVVHTSGKSNRVATDASAFGKLTLINFGGSKLPSGTDVLASGGVTTLPTWISGPDSMNVVDDWGIISQSAYEVGAVAIPDTYFSCNYFNSKEIWVYVKTDPTLTTGKAGVSISLNAVNLKTNGETGYPQYECYTDKNFVCYVEDGNGGWKQPECFWGRAMVDAGYEGWVRYPLTTDTFTASNQEDLNMNITDLQKVQVCFYYGKSDTNRAQYTSYVDTICLQGDDVQCQVNTTVGLGASISPENPLVNYNASQEFTLSYDAGYTAGKVYVNGQEIQVTNNKFTLTNIKDVVDITVTSTGNGGLQKKVVADFEQFQDGTDLKNDVYGMGLFVDPGKDNFTVFASNHEVESGKSMKWTVSSKEASNPFEIEFGEDSEIGFVNWGGTKDIMLYVDASQVSGPISLQFSFISRFFDEGVATNQFDLFYPKYNNSHVNEFTYYYYDQAIGWMSTNNTRWGRALLPSGYSGWVRFPIESFTSERNISSADLLEIIGCRINVNFETATVGQSGATVYLDSISILTDSNYVDPRPESSGTESQGGNTSSQSENQSSQSQSNSSKNSENSTSPNTGTAVPMTALALMGVSGTAALVYRKRIVLKRK